MKLETDVPVAQLTTIKVGGVARYFTRAETESDVVEALRFADDRKLPTYVLGGGSNVVVPDAGIHGLLLAVDLRGIAFEEEQDRVLVEASGGEPWDPFVATCVERGLRGLECLSGIPGRVGATPIQNVGAYGQEIAETLVRVRAFDRHEQRFVTFGAHQCGFGYRESRFKSHDRDRFVVTAVRFSLERGGPREIRYPELARCLAGPEPTLAEVRAAVLALRRSKSMLDDPADENARSCGSFFVNPIVEAPVADEVEQRFGAAGMPRYAQADGRVKLSAAWLIERSGIPRGTRVGNVGSSSRHALALVCHEGATATELLAFADEVRRRVRERTSVELTPEPVLW